MNAIKKESMSLYRMSAHAHISRPYLLIDNLTLPPPPQLTVIDKIISGQLIKACHQSLIMG